jgi:hypothetical protein
MSALAADLMADNALRRADERLEVARHAVRMLRNPEYLEALADTSTSVEAAGPCEVVLAKYLS